MAHRSAAEVPIRASAPAADATFLAPVLHMSSGLQVQVRMPLTVLHLFLVCQPSSKGDALSLGMHPRYVSLESAAKERMQKEMHIGYLFGNTTSNPLLRVLVNGSVYKDRI